MVGFGFAFTQRALLECLIDAAGQKIDQLVYECYALRSGGIVIVEGQGS